MPDPERPESTPPSGHDPDAAGPLGAVPSGPRGPSWDAVERLERLAIRGYAMLEIGGWRADRWEGFRPTGPAVRALEEEVLDVARRALPVGAAAMRAIEARLTERSRGEVGHVRLLVQAIERAAAEVRTTLVLEAEEASLQAAGRGTLETGRMLVHAGAHASAAAWARATLIAAIRRRTAASATSDDERGDGADRTAGEPAAADPRDAPSAVKPGEIPGPCGLDEAIAVLDHLRIDGRLAPEVAERAVRCLRLADDAVRAGASSGEVDAARVRRLVAWTVEVVPRIDPG